MKTKTIVFVAPGKAELLDRELDEKLTPERVLLKTEVTLISPGTEFANLTGNTNRNEGSGFPHVLGYSAVARVLEVGSAVTTLREGDRCLCYHSCHSN